MQPRDGDWTWGLELESYGFAGSTLVPGECAEPSADGNRMTYGWGANLEEWYINDGRGLEHGYTLASRPEGAGGSLTFDLAVRGSLQPKVQKSGTGITFWDAEGLESLSYSGLHVFDANGVTQPAHFTLAGETIQIVIDEAEATYPLTVDPVSQRDYLKAFNTDVGDHFGASVAMAEDRVAVGAPGEDSNAVGVNVGGADNSAPDAGAVYVFQYSGNRWRIIAYLKAHNTGTGDRFGASVAMERNRIVVGAPGEDSDDDRVGTGGSDDLAPDSGAAYVFDYSSAQASWSQVAYLKAADSDAGDAFGTSVAVSDLYAAVGAPFEDGEGAGFSGDSTTNSKTDSGAVFLYRASNFGWTVDGYAKATNSEAMDHFGASVALDMPLMYVGAPDEDGNAVGVGGFELDNSMPSSGAVYAHL
ncbi:MAG: FG-GAP repeat protein, partial [Planctomycetota bacterium]|nr:FG-GAP repeat protein [Planctomycetota bacterium]